MSNLTSAQQRALALDKNISVTAGAGSGKTRILVERYLKIVLDDPRKVKRVIAFTFTNKAAGEMQERVAGAVKERLAEASDPKEQRKLLAVRDQLNSAAISTIHSFCARVLREFPIEAGLSPDFSEIEDMQQIILKQEAIDRVFEALNEQPDEDEKQRWLFLFSHINRNRVTEILQTALGSPYEMSSIIHRYQEMNEEDYIQFLTQLWLQMVKSIIGEINFESFARVLDQIITHSSDSPKNAKGALVLEEFVNIKQDLTAGRDESEQYAAFIRLAGLVTKKEGNPYANAAQLGGKASWDDTAVSLIVQLSELCSVSATQLYRQKPGNPPDEADRLWFGLIRLFLELYELVSRQYSELKEESGLVDFEDLQMLTLRLLKSNPEVRNELINRYDFILVDEFQDTDSLQWEIIRFLSGSGETFTGEKVFVVGDPKQSIYGFRNADIRIFRDVKRLFAKHSGFEKESAYDGNVIFEESFRFLPRLNAFINYLFARVLQESEISPYEVGFHPLRSMRDVPGKGEAELIIHESGEEHVEKEAEAIAQRIKTIIDEGETCFKWEGAEKEIPITYGDIAILLRQRTHLLEIEQALRKYGIPFKTAGGIGFWQKQEIFDFYHLLRFITNPKDDFALIALLRSKMFLLSDTALFLLSNEEGATYWERLQNFMSTEILDQADRDIITTSKTLIGNWLQLRERIPLDQLLHKIMDDLLFETVLAAQLNGDQLIANINKLIDQAQAFSLSGTGGLQDFLNHLDDVIEREMREGEAQITLDDTGTVKIMTIHASKGLQFPVVILPFLNSKLKGKQSTVFIDGEIGLAAKLNSGIIKADHDEHVLLNILKYRQRQKDLAEAKRLFYVAATRASNRLIMSAALKEGAAPEKDSALGWVHEAFEQDGTDILSAEIVASDSFQFAVAHNPEYQATYSDHQSPGAELEGLKSYFTEYQPDPEKTIQQLRPLTESIKGRVFSATRIMTFLNNPDDYYHRYHLGFFEQDYDSFGDDVYKSDHGILKGKILHRYLELAGRGNRDQDELLNSILFDFDVFEGALSNEIVEEIKGLVKSCYASEYAAGFLNAEEYRNELSVTTCLGSDYFTGTLDRIYKNAAGLWEVVDYKTNRISQDQVNSEAEKYTWQMKAYAFLLNRLYPDQPAYPVTLYFVQPDRIFRKIFNAEACRTIAESLMETIGEINKRFPLSDV